MTHFRFSQLFLALAALCVLSSMPARAVGVTSPKQEFGFDIGDDYQLANYTQMKAYFEKLDRESDRVKVVPIGETEEGRTQVMTIITSPKNHRRLERFREISNRLATADGLNEERAAELAREGRAVVWIDGGLHSSETLGFMQLIETVYRLTSGEDAETRRFLDDLIILAVPANPDGIELVANWYLREKDPTKRSLAGVPRLYQKYIGHDNNRDFYACTQRESQAMNRVLYRLWNPQIMYNHHQTGPVGTVMFAPPFRDPFNYRVDPLIISGLDMVGGAMLNRFLQEGKGGVVQRAGAAYSAWWNGGLRTTAYFHNIIGLLTETIGNPTPMQVPFVPDRLLPGGNQVLPVEPQEWRFRQSIDYSLTANRAVMDFASKHRVELQLSRWRMGMRQIEKGRADSWTPSPRRIQAARRTDGSRQDFERQLRKPEHRDPRGFVIPSDQPDFATAIRFARALMNTGVRVHRATAAFKIGDTDYPTGSLVVRCDQAFRPHVLDLFEPQDHPDDFRYPGGPPIAPYDSAGWTLAFQMGFRFDRILTAFEAPVEELAEEAPFPAGALTGESSAAGYLLHAGANHSFVTANRLMKRGLPVRRTLSTHQIGTTTYPTGSFFIPASPASTAALKDAVRSLGVDAAGVATAPAVGPPLRPARIALWDTYGGSMTSGWTRFILERWEFPFEVIYPAQIDAGALRSRCDVLLLPDGAFRLTAGTRTGFGAAAGAEPDESNLPAEYRGRRGRLSRERTVPAIREFLGAGGTVLSIGSSTDLARALGLPVASALVESGAGSRTLPREKFFIPGSILEVRVDPTQPIALGMGERADVVFDESPAFRVRADDRTRVVAWYGSPTPLRSGWAWGQSYLDGAAAVVDASVGTGHLVLYGPEVLFRAQPHGTFKMVFNALYAPVN